MVVSVRFEFESRFYYVYVSDWNTNKEKEAGVGLYLRNYTWYFHLLLLHCCYYHLGPIQ